MEWWFWVIALLVVFCLGLVTGFSLATRHLMSEINDGLVRVGGKTFTVTEKRGKFR